MACVRAKLPQSSIVDIISSHAAGPYRVYLLTYKVGYDHAFPGVRVCMRIPSPPPPLPPLVVTYLS